MKLMLVRSGKKLYNLVFCVNDGYVLFIIKKLNVCQSIMHDFFKEMKEMQVFVIVAE